MVSDIPWNETDQSEQLDVQNVQNNVCIKAIIGTLKEAHF